jgi:sulfide:quinone oxidoreductase
VEETMSRSDPGLPKIVVLGGGLGGVAAAYAIRDVLDGRASLHLVSNSAKFCFVPSNPWVAVNWRKAAAIEVALPPVLKRLGIMFTPVAAEKVQPEKNRIQLADGKTLDYDFLVIATGPDLAFDQVPGLGPVDGFTQSICTTSHAEEAAGAFEAFCTKPGPIVVGAAPGASCFGPAYEFTMILDTELRRRKIRDRVPMTFVTPEPYVGHLGLDGVGDTRSMLESEFRGRHIKWITNARIAGVEPGKMQVEEVAENGSVAKTHVLHFDYSMILPAFRGIAAVRGIEGMVNPKGFVLVDEYQRNPKYPNVFALGVCIAIPPVGTTAVPVGVPKTGFMIETMALAIAKNLRLIVDGKEPSAKPTWNAICFADFGDDGVAFVAQPQIPPRNVNWSSQGHWVHLAKKAFEKYFLRKVRKGIATPRYERLVFEALGIDLLRPEAKVKEIGEPEIAELG